MLLETEGAKIDRIEMLEGKEEEFRTKVTTPETAEIEQIKPSLRQVALAS